MSSHGGGGGADPALVELAAACGVQLDYWDGHGQHRFTSVESALTTLRALGIPIERPEQAGELIEAVRSERAIQPCWVVWDAGDLWVEPPADRALLRLEDGSSRDAIWRDDRLCVAGPIPHGYHQLLVDDGARTVEVICAPYRAWGAPDESARRWGLFAPLYAVRRDHGSGAGNLADLGRLADWATDLGAQLVGTLPLLAGFLGDAPHEYSPYGPVSRRFWNELYLDLDALGCPLSPAQEQRARELAALDLVDYRGQMALVRSRLEPVAAAAWRDRAGELEAFIAAEPDVEDYARFRATVERRGTTFDSWPAAQANGTLTPEDYDDAVRRYHVYCQWALDQQLRELGQRTQLYLDLPVGVHRGGYDVWRERSLFASGVSAGAPPDALFSGGQNWGAPPINPRASRKTGHRHIAAAVRAHMRYASLLRVDHVIGLHRMYWVADGAPATDGCYVTYPSNELYAVLCLESHRNHCAVAGEDLGTVPDEVRPALDGHGMYRLHVGQFDLPDRAEAMPGQPPLGAVASLNTHDTPTFAGYWRGNEIDDREEMGLLDAETAQAERDSRGRQREAAVARWNVEGNDPRIAVVDAWHGDLAGSPAQVVLITIEDLWLEELPQNVPGTGSERPNWRRRMSRTLDEILADDHLAERLRALNARRSR